MTARLKLYRRLAGIAVFAMLPAFSFGEYFGGTAPASAEAIRPPALARPVIREQVLPRPRPNGAAPSAEPEIGVDPIAQEVELLPGFGELARRSGEPQVPGLVMVYLYHSVCPRTPSSGAISSCIRLKDRRVRPRAWHWRSQKILPNGA